MTDKTNAENVFITGATGFLALNLIREILEKEENDIYLLIRDKDNKSASERKEALVKKILRPEIQRKAASKIHVVKGDITKRNLGLDKKDLERLGSTINAIYHCAALTGFLHKIGDIRKVNVKGTENILKLALEWQKNGCLKNVNHISTAYIAGDHNGIFYERDTDLGQNFNNTYEQTKFEAELVVDKYRKKGLRVDIYRPSIITDTVRPGVNTATGLLGLLEVGVLEAFRKIPAYENAALNMIPVDAASRAIYLISTVKNRPINSNYHIVNPKVVRLGMLLDTASKFLGFKRPECVPLSRFDMKSLTSIQRKIIGPFTPYLNQRLYFDMQNADSIFKKCSFEIPPINESSFIKVLKHYKSSSPIVRRGSYAIKK